MEKGSNKKEIDAVLKATEQMRAHLQKTWQKVEDLEASIDANQATCAESRRLANEAKEHRPNS